MPSLNFGAPEQHHFFTAFGVDCFAFGNRLQQEIARPAR